MSNAYVMKRALELIDQGKSVATVTIIATQGSTPRESGTMMAVLEDGSIYGTIGGGIFEKHLIDLSVEAIEKNENKFVSLDLGQDDLKMICGGSCDVFINVHKSKPRLLIAGGGHVGYALFKAAENLGFDIIIFEDREELLNNGRYEGAYDLVTGRIDEELKKSNIDRNTYIVIATRGHEYDQSGLEAVIDSDARYIGVIGSKRKVTTMMNNLREKGIKEEKLKEIYSPMGINIDDGSPEEIAISILAEILLVKNNGELRHMKLK